jgi:CRP-like cAMP-binding protein/regulator of replication initiation timing
MSGSNDISATQIEALRKMAKTYRAGELICLEGEPTQDLMFLLSGVVDILQSNAVVKTVSGRQMFFGHVSFFSSKKRTATMRAKTACEVVRIREDRIESLLSKVPSLAMRLMRDVTQLFVDKDEELTRYKQGVISRKSPEGTAVEKMAHDFMPVVLVALLAEVSMEARVELAMTLIDAMEPQLDLSKMTISGAGIAKLVTIPGARATLDSAVKALVREKSEAGGGLGDGVDAKDALAGIPQSEISAAIQRASEATGRLRKAVVRLVEERLSLGAENALKSLRQRIAEMTRAVNEEQMGKLAKLAGRGIEAFERIEKTDQYPRATEQYRAMVTTGKDACRDIIDEAERLAALSSGATRRTELLARLRFEI